MTNANNIQFVVERLLKSLAVTRDKHFKEDLVQRILQCAERFAPSNGWYLRTTMRVFELGGDKVREREMVG